MAPPRSPNRGLRRYHWTAPDALTMGVCGRGASRPTGELVATFDSGLTDQAFELNRESAFGEVTLG